jgi:hypothetical protein
VSIAHAGIQVLAHVPVRWNRLIDKNMREPLTLEHAARRK